jgi:hypothetical protein
MSDDFFIGWREDAPAPTRRFMLGAAVALIGAGGALGAALAMKRERVGDGVWDQGRSVTFSGVLDNDPYPLLRTRDLDGAVRTVFLATSGKSALRPDPTLVGATVAVSGTLIVRGRNAMMAVAAMRPADARAQGVPSPAVEERGAALLVGEILDAKCWFGAMRPGYGKTHKACAVLCARGGLPLAFCQQALCGDGADAPLFLDQDGRAFGREILPLVADPVRVEGRLVGVGDVLQLRVPRAAIRRL